ncbi:MAG: hypothetical protein AAFY67_24600 [Cyanobacteria bacterium J06642_9]
MNIQQFLHEYNQGDRNFSELNLHGVDLSRHNLSGTEVCPA